MTRAQDSSVDRIVLLDEKAVMLERTRRLEGQAMDDFLASYESRGPDRSSLFVRACDALAFTLQSIDSFIQTSDRRFLVLANRGINADCCIRCAKPRHYVATCVSVELPRLRIQLGEKPASVFSVSVGRFRLRLKGTLGLLTGVRIPASQLAHNKTFTGWHHSGTNLETPSVPPNVPFLHFRLSEPPFSGLEGWLC